MNRYGIRIKGKTDLYKVGMLVHSQLTQKESNGIYTPPKMTAKQQERYSYLMLIKHSEERYGLSRLFTNSFNNNIRIVTINFDGNKITWETVNGSLLGHSTSCAGFEVWRIPKDVKVQLKKP